MSPQAKNDLTTTGVWENRKSILICCLVATASFQYGLDFSFIGGFQAITMLMIAIVYTAGPTSPSGLKCLVAFLCIYIFFYGGWTGPVAWLCAGEIPSTRLRSYALGFGSGTGFLLGWVCAFAAPYFINPLDLNWGRKYGYIWFGSNLITFTFIFFYVPETKDRTLEEINEMFQARVGARIFRNYQCVVSEQAREHGLGRLGEKGALEQVESVREA